MGCSKNLVDSEQLLHLFQSHGYIVYHNPEQTHGDIAVVNTCGFIGDAKEESINMILELCGLKEDGLLKQLYVMGCLSERYLAELEQEIPQADVAVMCGPSHAEEVGRCLPTTVVAGAKSQKTAEKIQDLFMNDVFRVYTSPDMLGMELGGSLKNVIALAAGMADGLGYGDNTKAALITRGIAEITRLAVAMGAKIETLCGLTGIGDLIVTCESRHSRNRKAGMLIGQGYTMEQATREVKMVVEGIYSAKAALALARKYDVELPIIEEVNKVLFEDKPAREAVTELMVREKRVEHLNLEWKHD